MTVSTRQQLWGNLSDKEAEASGTSVMPNAAEPDKTPDSKDLKFIPKSAHVTHVPDGVVIAPVAGKQAPANPQTPSRVRVSGKEAPAAKKEKQASYFALPSVGKYPLDSYSDVEKAASYFDEWRGEFSPPQRREFCRSVVKRASALGIKVSDTLAKYGSATYGSPAEIELGISCRMAVVNRDDGRLLEKVAEERAVLQPEYYAAALEEFDKIAGIDHLYDKAVLDPYYSTYGVKVAEDADGSTVIGNDVIMHNDLVQLAHTECVGMKKVFGNDFVKEFRKDPIAIFTSMPNDQKRIIGRMAADVLIHY